MTDGLLIFTYAVIFAAGLTLGAGAVGSWWLYSKYRELFNNLKNIKVEITDAELR